MNRKTLDPDEPVSLVIAEIFESALSKYLRSDQPNKVKSFILDISEKNIENLFIVVQN